MNLHPEWIAALQEDHGVTEDQIRACEIEYKYAKMGATPQDSWLAARGIEPPNTRHFFTGEVDLTVTLFNGRKVYLRVYAPRDSLPRAGGAQ